MFTFQNFYWFFLLLLSRFCMYKEKYGDLNPHLWLLVILLQLVLLILFAEQLNQRNFVTRRSLLILPLVCLPLLSFLEPNFWLPSTPFSKSPVHFLKTDVVIALLLLMAVDIMQQHFWKILSGYMEIWSFFILMGSICSICSWCFSL